MYLTINKINGYIEESNGNECLTLVPADESKDTLTRYGELWDNIKDLIRSTSNNSDGCNKKYMKNKFDLDDGFTLKKALGLNNMIIVIRSVFNKGNKYYSQVFIDKCLYKL